MALEMPSVAFVMVTHTSRVGERPIHRLRRPAGEHREVNHEPGSLAVEGMGVGGVIGTAVGSTIAAVAAVGISIIVPGLGLVIAGPIAAAFAGGGAGAVTGGVIGLLSGLGFNEENVEAYHAALREGGVVLGVVPRSSDDAAEIEKAFRNAGGENVCRSC